MNIRLLRADEIECRVQSVKEKGFILLLYKDARCDMRILDETFGIDNWQRHHEVVNDNLFCNVGVRFERENGFGEWVWKQDVGTESNTEKEKGQASDSFKRACFNWGIGRELYTAPFIWVVDQGYIKGGKVYTRFKVSEIGYNENKEINQLVIVDDKGKEVYKLGSNPTSTTTQNIQVNVPDTSSKCSSCGVEINNAVKTYSLNTYNKALCRDCQGKVK